MNCLEFMDVFCDFVEIEVCCEVICGEVRKCWIVIGGIVVGVLFVGLFFFLLIKFVKLIDFVFDVLFEFEISVGGDV